VKDKSEQDMELLQRERDLKKEQEVERLQRLRESIEEQKRSENLFHRLSDFWRQRLGDRRSRATGAD
jgi:hypothetical protein